MKTACKFRLYPNSQRETQLDLTPETRMYLWNTALDARKNAYEVEGISRSYENQAAMLTFQKIGQFQRRLSRRLFRYLFPGALERSEKSPSRCNYCFEPATKASQIDDIESPAPSGEREEVTKRKYPKLKRDLRSLVDLKVFIY